MQNKADITSELESTLKPKIELLALSVNSIDINDIAIAIIAHKGAVGGFTGSNGGWTRPVVRPPLPGEQNWGHCVELPAFGLLEFDLLEFKAGTKCLFTPNSWGGRYTIDKGRWKGYQAIPESYFTADGGVIDPSSGKPAVGYFAFRPWVVVEGIS